MRENIGSALDTGRRLAVYGIGDAAFQVNAILGDHYEIIGFLDRDPANTGRRLFDSEIISMEGAAAADAIVIAANPVYWNVIYSRIAPFAEQHDIAVFYTNGTRAEPYREPDPQEMPCWNRSMAELEQFCADCEIVSFDIFDTLIARKTAGPNDIFPVVAERIPHRQVREEFAFRRLQAEARCRKEQNGIYGIRDIYDRMGFDADTTNALLEAELEAEKHFFVPRREMRSLLLRLVAAGRRVILVSDMYLPSHWLAARLSDHGIRGYERLFVSGEEQGTKESGALWKQVRAYAGDSRICHIGDNLLADVIRAEEAGIPSFHCMSEAEMLRSSTLASLERHASTPGDDIALGMIRDRLMNDPFGLFGSGGRPTVSHAETFGYAFFGPLVYTFFSWFLERIAESGTPIPKLFFTARDGWFFHRVYSSLRPLNLSLPESHYLPASRRLCGVAAFFSEEDVYSSLFPAFTGRLDVFFRIRMGISYPGAEPGRIIRSDTPEIARLVRERMDEILRNAAVERERYRAYIQRHLPDGFEGAALFDFGKNGTVQHCLEKICGCEFTGLYVYLNDESPWAHSRCAGLYRKTDGDGFTVPEKLTSLCEAVFTAPEGTCLYIKESGGYATDETVSNRDHFDQIEGIHEGILRYIREHGALANHQCFGMPPRKEFAAAVLNATDRVELHHDIKAACKVGDNYMGQPMTPVFY